jgi:hypothetical protein
VARVEEHGQDVVAALAGCTAFVDLGVDELVGRLARAEKARVRTSPPERPPQVLVQGGDRGPEVEDLGYALAEGV